LSLDNDPTKRKRLSGLDAIELHIQIVVKAKTAITQSFFKMGRSHSKSKYQKIRITSNKTEGQ